MLFDLIFEVSRPSPLLCHFCPLCSCPSRIGQTVEQPNLIQQNLVSGHHYGLFFFFDIEGKCDIAIHCFCRRLLVGPWCWARAAWRAAAAASSSTTATTASAPASSGENVKRIFLSKRLCETPRPRPGGGIHTISLLLSQFRKSADRES